jgi:hypothetical protein
VYPEYQWLPWKFISTPRNYWTKLHNQRAFFKWLEKEMQIKSVDDWSKVTVRDIQKKGGAGLLDRYDNSLPKGNLSKLYYQAVISSFKSNVPTTGFEIQETSFRILE